MSDLSLSNLDVETAVVEARYANNFLLWDRAGALWQKCLRDFPDAKVQKAEPGQTLFHWKNQFELSAGLGQASFKAHFPKASLEEFARDAGRFMQHIIDVLEIPEFSRIGYRAIYSKKCDSIEEASKLVLSLRHIVGATPQGRVFDISPTAVRPDCSLRLEDDALGVTVRVRAESRKLSIEPAPNLVRDLTPREEERFFAVYDVDYYTKGITSVSQVRVGDWLNHVIRVVRRDSDAILK